ncbi:MAG: OstA-like protein [Bacteroidia bacterium]
MHKKRFLQTGLLFLIISGWLTAGLYGQPGKPVVNDTAQSKRVKILHASILSYLKSKEAIFEKLVGRVEMMQDSTLFFCDSAYFYETDHRLEAYSRVRIEMPDSVFLYGDKLTYDTESKISEVYRKIKLTNQDVVLTTDRLTYFRNEDYGFYREGGKMVDGDNVLTSIHGYYYPRKDMAYFRDSVKLVNPDYVLTTDTLGYDTENKISYFLTKTFITSKDGEIETENGNYDTDRGIVNLYSRSIVRDSSYLLVADTLTYFDKRDMGFARGNVLVFQDDSSLQIRGGLAEFNRKTDESWVTREAVAIHLFDDDTLYMMADTLFSIKQKKLIRKRYDAPVRPDTLSQIMPDSASNRDMIRSSDSVAADSLAADSVVSDTITARAVFVDTLEMDEVRNMVGPMQTNDELYEVDTVEIRLFKAYNNVRFFMNNMQGRADSMVYFYDDSVMYLYHDPVLWSDENQLTGDTIIIWMKNEKADSMWVGKDGFLASREDTVGYNQVKGKEMRAKFKDNELYRMHIIGNSESIYFAKNEDDTTHIYYEGMNKALAQEMVMYFRDNEVKRIVFLSQPEGTYSPFFKVIFEANALDGLKWRITERPEKPSIFKSETIPGTEEVPTEDVPTEEVPTEEASVPTDETPVSPPAERPTRRLQNASEPPRPEKH